MEFRDLAAKETSALVTRLSAGSGESSRQRLRAFRTAIEAATKALESALTSHPDVEHEIVELVNRLTKAATTEADARIQRLSAEARKASDALRADLAALAEEKDLLADERATLAGSLKDAHSHADAMKAEVTALSKEKQALGSALKDAQSKAETLRGQLNGLAKEKQALALALEDSEAKTEALRAELTGLSKDKQTLASSFKDLQAAWETLRADLTARTEEKDSVAAALSEAQAQADALQSDLHDERKRTEGYRRELAEARAALQSAEAARDDALSASEQDVAARLAAERELLDVRGALESGRAESSDAKSQLLAALDERAAALAEKAALQDALGAAESQAQAAETKLASLMTLFKASSVRVKALERQQAESEEALREMEGRLAETVAPAATGDRSVVQLDSLLESFRALANATTISDILTTLVEHLAAEFPRVALFHVKGNRLEGGHQIGFDFDNDIAKVVIPLSINSLMTRAVSSGRIERLEGDELTDASGAPFGGAPRSAIAMPVVVQEETLAIVYADDSGQADGDRGASEMSGRYAEALLQHAVALLMRLNTELRTLTELRAYAASLVTEVEQMYAADVGAGKTGEDLKNRLKANVEFARSLFETRIALESPDSGGLFDDQVGTAIEAQASAPFGRDLAVVAGRAPAARAAEAS